MLAFFQVKILYHHLQPHAFDPGLDGPAKINISIYGIAYTNSTDSCPIQRILLVVQARRPGWPLAQPERWL